MNNILFKILKHLDKKSLTDEGLSKTELKMFESASKVFKNYSIRMDLRAYGLRARENRIERGEI